MMMTRRLGSSETVLRSFAWRWFEIVIMRRPVGVVLVLADIMVLAYSVLLGLS
jgi:hypothetical protein